ncbi:peptide/nickel transport system ATP-binding protein [Halovenus aranensis]|uniref:Peptide/nickel transport system ATP-binding protein n=1 Tax=Halovenus aranensis TaxID=890420 RepID=A0A1G8VMR5_9EURY|nr:oligopeptide/dipeptide ABC transporter ATP-binding protein [Halovenus aranensis]SDJ67368.1 peptide/nickel transport system ATP-binding protein [Halovenus aranensis]
MSDSTTADDAGRTDASNPLVTVDGLRTYYESEQLVGGKPVKAVDGVSFEIGRGETFGIVGESGCGKTTLGRSILQLEDVDEGRVSFDGTDVTTLGRRGLKEWRRDAQMVYQNPMSSINERMTVGEIVREPLEVHNWETAASRRERVQELLDRVGLRPEHYHRYPHQFSGGQRQRVGIARALALEPEFIVLDEPVSALDVSVQAKILNLLSDLQEEFGLTYMLIAHDLSVVRHICDRVGVMYLGKLMEVGPTERLFTSPQNPYTRSLLSAIPQPDPDVGADRITLRGTPPNPRDPPAGCVFSTRCPFAIRQPEHEELGDEQWAAIAQFRRMIRERASSTTLERAKQRLGMGTQFTPIREVAEDLFGSLTYPEAVEETLTRATELVADGDVTEARDLLDDEFSTVCEHESPQQHEVGNGRSSRCHRHREEYREPGDYLRDAGDYLPE